MVYFAWFARLGLASLFGLVSFSAFAQEIVGPMGPVEANSTIAHLSCQEAAVQAEIDLENPSSPAQAYSLSPNCTKIVDSSQGGVGYYAVGIAGWITSGGQGPYYSAPGNYSFYSYPVVRIFRFAVDDDEPTPDPCSGVSNFLTTSLFASTPNGGGDACLDGCSYRVYIGYVGTYPSGYMDAEWVSNSRACTSGDAASTPTPPTGVLDLPPDQGGVDTNAPDPGPGPDGDGKGSSSGGATCDAPPACSGDSIQCNILFQTWSTRCEAAKLAEGSGDSELAQEIRDGLQELIDTVADGNADLLSAVNDLNSDLSVKLDASNANTAAINNTLNQALESDPNASAGLSGLVYTDEISPSVLDTSGWGFPRSCPSWSDINFSVGFTSVSIPLSSFSAHCDLFELTGYLILGFSAFWSARYLMRS